MRFDKSIASVKIVSVHDGERLLHHIAGGAQGVGGAPGLFPAFRHGEAFRQVVQRLESVIHLNLAGKTAADLNTQERMMACVDISQALTESRPYKQGMSHEKACGILKDMADKSWLDADIVSKVDSCFRT